MVTIKIGGLDVPARVIPIPEGEMIVVNHDPKNQWQNDISSFPTVKEKLCRYIVPILGGPAANW